MLGAIPSPSSVTVNVMAFPSCSALSWIEPLRCVWTSALPIRLSKTWAIRSRSTAMERAQSDRSRQGDARVHGVGLIAPDRLAEQAGRRGRLQIMPCLARSRQVEEVVDHGQNPFGILPALGFGLPWIERADGLFEQEMDHICKPVSGVLSS